MRRSAIGLCGLILASALGGCHFARDPACMGRTAASATPSAAEYAAMSVPERRQAEARLNAEARLCNWEP